VAITALVFMAATCSASDAVGACPTPVPGSKGATLLDEARSEARFNLVYPCDVPAGEALDTVAVTGVSPRQQVEFAFDGPFDIKLRQSQFPPPVNPDPTGATRTDIALFPNVQAILIERNDGSPDALYHLFWSQDGLHYEVQVTGPPLQRRAVLEFARSLK